jgi:hypothetical protein
MSRRPPEALLTHIRIRYQKGNKATKKSLLDDFCESFNYHRKAAIRLLSQIGPDRWGRPGPGPKRRYQPQDVLEHLKAIWLATDQMGSKKLKAALPLWLPHYQSQQGLLSLELKAILLAMSPATIDRLLKPLRIKHPRKGICGTRPGTLLKHQIPIKTDHWDISQPGFLEADTVAHCGSSLQGQFIWSLTLTDIYSGWTQVRATWNKGAEGILEQIQHIEQDLPFQILGFDCDNGSEFLNYHLMRYFSEHKNPIQFTRSRPYRKNDNAHVEQKNWTHVRHLFGYDRLDNPRITSLMNDLYAHEWSLLQNFFHPVMKLTHKSKIGSRYQKSYDSPKTPYQRLLLSPHLSSDQKLTLQVIYNSLNPFDLKLRINQKLQQIFKFVKVTPNVRQRI